MPDVRRAAPILMHSSSRSRILVLSAAVLGLFLAQFVAADNWPFRTFAADTDAWRSFSYIPLPDAPHHALLRHVGPVFLQPSLAFINRAWAPLINTGRPLRSPIPVALLHLCSEHRLAFLILVAAFNTLSYGVLGLVLLRGAHWLRTHPRRSTHRPA